MKRLLAFFLLLNVACVDDRDVSLDDVVVNPEYRLNFVNFELTANTLNQGNLSEPDQITDFAEVDFLREDINVDYLETVSFEVATQNGLDQPVNINFQFADIEENLVYEFNRTIAARSSDGPTYETFTIDLNAQEVNAITDAFDLQATFNQPDENDQSGSFSLTSIVHFSYRYTP